MADFRTWNDVIAGLTASQLVEVIDYASFVSDRAKRYESRERHAESVQSAEVNLCSSCRELEIGKDPHSCSGYPETGL
jgi:hypothetical protein